MPTDIFGKEISEDQAFPVNVYADEIQEVSNVKTKERWVYTGAIYERADRSIIEDLVDTRYLKQKPDWEKWKDKNDSNIHWNDLKKNSASTKFIIKRWLDYILSDCSPGNRKLHFSLTGINISNLNITEFGKEDIFNNVYNRFFRSMLKYSLKKFFGKGVVVENIFHEDGQQANHIFNWHTIFKLDQDEHLSFNCDEIQFLPKSHKKDERSNALQLCDVLLGIFKDMHLGYNLDTYPNTKTEILNTTFTRELLSKRIIKAPRNFQSSYGYANRFHISLFPKTKSTLESNLRKEDNFYDISKVRLEHEHLHQLSLF